MIVELKAGMGSLSKIAEMAEGVFHGEDRFVFRLATHSEEIRGGELFAALSGKDDGFYYIERAKKNGAAAVLCDRVPSVDIPYILVNDVPRALGKWAHAARVKMPIKCIAVTGSVGKTSTKNAIFSLLKDFYKVHATSGNYNNLLGVSFTLLSMPRDTEILVVELGTSKKGEIRELSKIVSPSDAVITAIGRAHLEAFISREGVSEEKLGILSGMASGGRLFVPSGEPLLSTLPSEIKRIPTLPINSNPPDVATDNALGFAAEIALAYGVEPNEIKKRIALAKSAAERRKGKVVGDIMLIDDAYNASPESMLAAFEYLKSIAKGRRILVLGDMMELGKNTAEIHAEVGKACASVADLVFLFGASKDYYKSGIEASEKAPKTILLRGTGAKAFAKEILSELRARDTVLFKASHGAHADEIYEALLIELNKRK